MGGTEEVNRMREGREDAGKKGEGGGGRKGEMQVGKRRERKRRGVINRLSRVSEWQAVLGEW